MTLTQEVMRRKCSEFYNEGFRRMHGELITDGRGHAGHGPDHDMLVAGYALAIAGDDLRLAEKSWIAAHLHSIDRFFGNDHEMVISKMLVLVSETDENFGLSEEEIAEIKLAVFRHSMPNADDDSMVQIVLQDADRLANVMPYVITRVGQFRWDLPVVELGYTGLDKHPESTHQKPRSAHDALIACLEWHPDSGTKFAIRTQKAREIGEELFVYLREWFALSDKHMKLAGL